MKPERLFVPSTVVFLSSLVGAGLAACDDCADMGCIQTVTVRPEVPIAGDGAYDVTFVGDGKTYHCTLTLPSSVPAKCSNSRAYVQHDEHTIAWLSLDGDFDQLSVTVTRDDAPVADQTFTVKYEGQELNGSGCGECPSATETLRLQPAGVPDAGAP